MSFYYVFTNIKDNNFNNFDQTTADQTLQKILSICISKNKQHRFMFNPILRNHIHRPAIERYATSKFNTIKNVQITAHDTTSRYKVTHRGATFDLNSQTDTDVFVHRVVIDGLGVPWFNRAGAGKDSRAYADAHSEQCLVSMEVKHSDRSTRRFASFTDNKTFVDYHIKSQNKHMYEIIRPNTVCMLFTDHDQRGGLSDIHNHNKGIRDFIKTLFRLLQLKEQKPTVLTSHREKDDGGYLSTHLRFTGISVENCEGTMKAIHHLVRHTGCSFGGLDVGTHKAYQQLRLPGCSKAGSMVGLLPPDGSPLPDISTLMVSNSDIRPVHITTVMVVNAIRTHFGCIEQCGLKQIRSSITIPTAELAHIEKQIGCLYYEVTGREARNLTHARDSLWTLDNDEQCIHNEHHASNRMFITVSGRSVICQCFGRCRNDHEGVMLGHLLTKLSVDFYPWEKSPRSCYVALLAIDTVQRLPTGIEPVVLAMHLACIGDFKSLLDVYTGCDTSADWASAISALIKSPDIPTARTALKDLKKHINYIVKVDGKNKKRKRPDESEEADRVPFTFKFDYARFFKHRTPASTSHQ
jgi:hypothetical protein